MLSLKWKDWHEGGKGVFLLIITCYKWPFQLIPKDYDWILIYIKFSLYLFTSE